MEGIQKIKCVVWDLDNTIWQGTILEDEHVILNSKIVEVIKCLDKRGILQSICSKNEYSMAKDKLIELGLWKYFLYPEINWNSKSSNITNIAKNLNIALDTFAFVDDQQFELDEVNQVYPQILCISAGKSLEIPQMDRMNPTFITEESKLRRQMYQNDIVRNAAEKEFVGTKEKFLASLNMKFKIYHAKEDDLKRAEELTIRTHQLNSTGYIYSYNDLKDCINNSEYELLVTTLEDKYGTYGTIGLALIHKVNKEWSIDLLLMSCRVMSRGVGNILLNYICNQARKENAIVNARFVPTNRNRIMYITYKFNGFTELSEKKKDNVVILQANMNYERKIPGYVDLEIN